MEKAVPKGAVGFVEVIFRVEGIEAVPTKLVLALGALHEFAATRADYTYLARGAHLSEKDLVKVTVEG